MIVHRLLTILPQLQAMLLKAAGHAFILEILKIIPPFLMTMAIDRLLVPGTTLQTISFYLAGVLVVSVVTTFFEDRFILQSFRNNVAIETSLLERAHTKLMSLGLRYHESHPSGELVHLLNKGSTRLGDLLWFIQESFLGASFQILLTCIALLWIHFYAGLVFVLFMPLVIWQIHQSAKRVQPYRQAYHEIGRKAAWEMNQSITNVRTVKDFVREGYEQEKYQKLLARYRELADTRIITELRDTSRRDITLGLARFAILFCTFYAVFQGSMSPGTLVLFATLSEKVVSSLYRLGRLYNFLGDSVETVRELNTLFDAKPDIIDRADAVSCPSLEGKIEFLDVNFAYQDELPLFRNVTLTIPPRSVVAVVGRSGSGKSSLVKLLMRHYDIIGGAILVDGIDIRKMKALEYRAKIAVVSQDIEVFDASIAANIAYGIDASLHEIKSAAKLAHIHEFIESLPEGYYTRVGERGIKLSGGQRQRVGVARALIKHPTILIFDEATASLDTESEREIQQALVAIARRQTTIIIAHRLSTIEFADYVVVLDNGKIVEQGAQQELIQSSGWYARMRSLQALGEIRA
jgi:ABC-type multidrug transport system fused ATPase/permease subunit